MVLPYPQGAEERWLEPPEDEWYEGACEGCKRFVTCPCGCGWGYCEQDPGELYDGAEGTCEDGVPL